MSAKSSNCKNHYLLLLFNNTDWALVGDAAGLQNSATAGSFYVSLHTADPGDAGSQTTNETTYTNYVRVAVARSSSGWTVTGGLVENTAVVSFASCGATGATLSHWGIGTDSSGAGELLYKGALGTALQGAFTAKVDDTITIPGHSFAVDNRCAFYPVSGSSLPTGITEGTLYFVKTVTGDDLTISTTQGGATLDITAVGDGVAVKALTLAVSSGIVPEFAAGVIEINEE